MHKMNGISTLPTSDESQPINAEQCIKSNALCQRAFNITFAPTNKCSHRNSPNIRHSTQTYQ